MRIKLVKWIKETQCVNVFVGDYSNIDEERQERLRQKLKNKSFVVKEEHIKLLQRAHFRYENYFDFGAPAMDSKRPYGNGDVYGDIGEILGWEKEELESEYYDEYTYSDTQREAMLKIHKEMTTVLEILAKNLSIELGEYEASGYGSNWKKV